MLPLPYDFYDDTINQRTEARSQAPADVLGVFGVRRIAIIVDLAAVGRPRVRSGSVVNGKLALRTRGFRKRTSFLKTATEVEPKSKVKSELSCALS